MPEDLKPQAFPADVIPRREGDAVPECLKLPDATIGGVTGPAYEAPPGVIKHEGREFASGGGIVTPTHLLLYLKRIDGTLCAVDWHGNVVSRDVKVIGQRYDPRSFVTNYWLYVHITINGVTYSGMGDIGMYVKARRIKGR